MIKYLLHFNLLLFILLPFTLFSQAPDPFFTEKAADSESLQWAKKASFTEASWAGENNLTYQRMEWQIDPAVRYISGCVSSRFISNKAGMRNVRFHLKSDMLVDSVTGRPGHLIFSHADDLLNINLKDPLEPGTMDSVKVYYRGEPDKSGFGSFEANFHQGVPVLWTLSEPYGALDWWPCKQSLTDKIDSIDIVVTSPALYRTASNGILVSDTVVNEMRTMHWRHRYPIATYLVAIAVTNYTELTDTMDLGNGKILPVVNYVYPENLAYAKSKLPATLDLIRLFNTLFGEYPFAAEKYGHAQFGWGGGMEHQTMSFMGSFEFELVAHELAHSWFGNSITLASWQDIWLNEGFATYATGLAKENLLSGDDWRNWKVSNVINIISQPGGSVFVPDTTDSRRIFSGRLSYAKGGYLLHMIRWVLGDEVFFRAVRNYFEDPEIKNGFATQADWVGHLEAASGLSFTEFFKDWYYGEGYPVYSGTFENKANNVVRIGLSQTPSHTSVGFFEMPVPVRLYSVDKKDSADFRLDHRFNGQIFDVPVNFTVAGMVVDPDFWLIRKVDKITGVADRPLADHSMKIFPNPSDGTWHLVLPADEIPLKVEIFTMTGTLLVELRPDFDSFSVPWLLPGSFPVRITTNHRVEESILIKK